MRTNEIDREYHGGCRERLLDQINLHGQWRRPLCDSRRSWKRSGGGAKLAGMRTSSVSQLCLEAA